MTLKLIFIRANGIFKAIYGYFHAYLSNDNAVYIRTRCKQITVCKNLKKAETDRRIEKLVKMMHVKIRKTIKSCVN